eukprot:COSAG06_NODE_352_length_16924_cov_168.566615_11_plen_131_part_00
MMLDGCRAHASEGDCDMEGRWQLQRHLRVTVESMDRLGVADGHELELKRGVAVNRSGQLDNARLNRLPPVEQPRMIKFDPLLEAWLVRVRVLLQAAQEPGLQSRGRHGGCRDDEGHDDGGYSCACHGCRW